MTIDAIMPGVRVLCAVSGGVDSMYLLHRMTALGAQRGFAVGCAHFNHGLRGAESDRDEAFVRAVEVSSNDPALSSADIKAALGNTQYGISSEIGHPLELTFTTPEAISIASVWLHASRSGISPRRVEVYRKESAGFVLAFAYTASYVNNQAEKSPESDLNGVSTSWKIVIVDTLMAEDANAEESLASVTYFSGLDIFTSSGSERADVAVKFVEESASCDGASAMRSHVSGEVLESVRFDACSGVLAPFTVADYTKTYKVCYAQTSAPAEFAGFVEYSALTLAFRYTSVASAGVATYAMAGVEKELTLTASTEDAITKILFEQGYILAYKFEEDAKGHAVIKIALKYHPETKVNAIKGLKRVSRPGLRRYASAAEMPRVLNGLGIAIVSTSKGIMTDKKARQENVGGEVLCYVY